MRNEKKLLVKEIEKHLDKSDYVFFTDFKGVSVSEVSELRRLLRTESGEFHVIKKTLLKKATEDRGLQLSSDWMNGQIALVVGGQNPAGVAKVLKAFHKSKREEKLAIRGGFLSEKPLSVKEIDMLSELPEIGVLRAQLLSLFNSPASQFVRTINAVPQGMLNVLQAKSKL